MELQNRELINSLCTEIKKNTEYTEYIQCKKDIEEDGERAFLIQKYHELQFKILAASQGETDNTENESEFKRIMTLIQEDETLLKYIISEYKINSCITGIFQDVAHELELPFYGSSSQNGVL